MNLQRQTKEYAKELRSKNAQIFALKQELLDTRAICGTLQERLDSLLKKSGKLVGTLAHKKKEERR